MNDERQSAPGTHWRKRARGNPLPREEAARQGQTTSLAFQILGKDQAIDFLNTQNARLGGRPLALATASIAGQASVEAELEQMRGGHVTSPEPLALDPALQSGQPETGFDQEATDVEPGNPSTES